MLVTKKEGQVVAGTLTLNQGRLRSFPNRGYEVLMRNVSDKAPADPDLLDSWFDDLPRFYNGTYLRANLKGE